MTRTQQLLRERTAVRIRAARPDLADRHDLATPDGLLDAHRHIAQEAGAADDGQILAAVVVRDVDLARWVRDTCVFALGVPPEDAAAWRASFTRTVFLAGNPDHLRDRFVFAHLADDGSAAWTAPGPAAGTTTLRRLLKLFDAPAEVPPAPARHLTVPGEPPPGRVPVTRGLHLATAGCTVAEALVHLNHVIAEAVLDGLIAPGDRLTLHRVPRINPLPGHAVRVRAVPDPRLPGRLRAAAALTDGD
ncbi:hypothetical protein JK361_02570 [Streptomyces sp. 5-8]|uniref:Uncharacterized protein n=1 Tax=Streptomyces musisoli TaxID=2802280 RepID=A0ABS1NUR3_9ACTN|nr:DUF6182 family protein [Streptomyces musisoli]MBL1103496.1 hypothetical protein [Streptomyces musisoli]